MASSVPNIPDWEKAKRKRCIQQFVKLGCVKKGYEALDIHAVDFDITLLDEEKMKSLLMDCIAALGVVRMMRIEQDLSLSLKSTGLPMTKETEIVLNDAFAFALSLAATSLLDDDTRKPEQRIGIHLLLRAFPGVSNDDSKNNDNEEDIAGDNEEDDDDGNDNEDDSINDNDNEDGNAANNNEYVTDNDQEVDAGDADDDVNDNDNANIDDADEAKKDSHTHSWLPLHWAILALSTNEDDETVMGLTQTTLKLIYTSDPMALERHHIQPLMDNDDGVDDNDDSDYVMGLTPAHLLCMRKMTNSTISMIKYFSLCNSQAFTMSTIYKSRHDNMSFGYSALHIACHLGNPTQELLERLIQLDQHQLTIKSYFMGLTPIGFLCGNKHCNDDLIHCLLNVNNSVEVVALGIVGCLHATDHTTMMDKVNLLIHSNPQAIYHCIENNNNLLHIAAQYFHIPLTVFTDFTQRIHELHQDAVKQICVDGMLPVQDAASYNTVGKIKILLQLYPESATIVTSTGNQNLLHLSLSDQKFPNSVIEAKVNYLCFTYPSLMLQKDGHGRIPLHVAITKKNIIATRIMCEMGEKELFKLSIDFPNDTNYPINGWLPLHLLIHCNTEALCDSLLSMEANCFRLMLRSYPEAAGIVGGIGDYYNTTPYQLSVDNDLPLYYLRLLLRAVPNLNPTELYRLNYEERRMALFLAFRARTSNIDPPFLTRLRFTKLDLLKHVISFL